MVILDKITKVYRFNIDKETWEHPGGADNFIAYKLYGTTLHVVDGNEIFFKKDMLMTCSETDFYSVLHNEITGGSGGCIAIHFTTVMPFEMHVSFFDCSSRPKIKTAFFKILDSWERFLSTQNAADEYKCISLFYELMSLISGIKNEKNTQVSEAKDYIERNYFNSLLSVEDVAEHISLSSRRLSRLFFDEYGETPGKYISSLRLSKAIELLKSDSIRISEIASRCGYSSSAYFIRVFKNETGVTPSFYRKHN